LKTKSGRKGLEEPHGRSSRSLPALLADEARFFKAWVENPVATGAVSPSGKALARAMAQPVDVSIPGLVIELGPGTGPVTQALIDHGVAPERLVLIEYDPAFCKLLERKFPGVKVVQGDAYNIVDTLGSFVTAAPVAAVVSSLPLLNRPETDRLNLLREAFELLDPRGHFIQFTYGMVSPIPRRSKNGQGVSFHAHASAPVWLNLPPARVWSYRAAGEVVHLSDARPHEVLLSRIKGGAHRVRDGILERRDRIETEIRLVRDRMRIDFELRAASLRKELEMKPALALWKKLNQGRRKNR
jgi:phosphatidylethanolamine/phosphatidyl-N-methylethanolamine N-methyltransferase